jgi:hypothetical protein
MKRALISVLLAILIGGGVAILVDMAMSPTTVSRAGSIAVGIFFGSLVFKRFDPVQLSWPQFLLRNALGALASFAFLWAAWSR